MTDEPSDPCPQCGEEMDGHLALEYEACLRALAATAGHDRGRELAERIVAEGVRAAIEWQQGDQSVTEAECVTATVSALADHGLLAAPPASTAGLAAWLDEQIREADRARDTHRYSSDGAFREEVGKGAAFREVRERLSAPPAQGEAEGGDVDLSAEVAVVERMLRHADLSTREVEAVRALAVQATESTKWVDESETRWDMAEALGFQLVEDAPSWRDLRDAARLAATTPSPRAAADERGDGCRCYVLVNGESGGEYVTRHPECPVHWDGPSPAPAGGAQAEGAGGDR